MSTELTDLDNFIFQRAVDSMTEHCEVLDAVVVATLDGRMLATQQRGTYPVERAAVMGSSLMALGDAIASELKLGSCEVIISENKEGIVVFNHINEDLALVSLTQSKSGLGTLLSWAKKTAEETASALRAARKW